jgi:hypothetical protein
MCFFDLGAKDISVSIVTARAWTAGFRLPAGVASGARPASCPRVKRQELESDHSPPFSAEAKNGGLMSPLPHTFSWRSV